RLLPAWPAPTLFSMRWLGASSLRRRYRSRSPNGWCSSCRRSPIAPATMRCAPRPRPWRASMERSEILDMMTALQLSGMRVAYDEIVTTGVKRQQGVEKVIGALLKAEIAAKQARSINYQMGVAKLPLAKELTDLDFAGTPINCELIAHLATGTFPEDRRNVGLGGGPGTGKSHIPMGITRSGIRAGRKARFFNAVDLANKLETETKLGRQGRTADALTRVNLVIL